MNDLNQCIIIFIPTKREKLDVKVRILICCYFALLISYRRIIKTFLLSKTRRNANKMNDDKDEITSSSQQTIAPTQLPENVNRRIKPLSKDVIDKIAAGEVIQRPVNAIKELLENSLDAGATSVNISVLDGGLKILQINDNGHGIGKEDLEIVCHRHTTSKLTSYEDLRSIGTFGFRGEALASVSQVAHVTIQTKTEDQDMGYEVEYTSKGDMKPNFPRVCARSKGTTITAKDMFYNFPQRRNSMTGIAEYRRIVDVIQKYALHNSGTAISLRKVITY
jgi:DNA mismatch repair protein MLH1